MRILYVEDHKDTAFVMGRLLQSQGHHVTITHTAKEAIALCVNNTFDLWILDVGLPDSHGGTLLRTLRRMDDNTKAIAITGHGMPEEILEGSDDGFDAYLVKPVTMQQVFDAIGQTTGSDA